MTEINEGGINRRSVVKAAAWAAPVVAVAAAAPMAAATPPPPVATFFNTSVDSGQLVNAPGGITISGRATQGVRTVNGSFPAGTQSVLTPPAGATITILDQENIASISPNPAGPGQSVTIIPLTTAVTASVWISIDVPGEVTVVTTAPGLPNSNGSGSWVGEPV